jgi:hypothetical protein
MTERKVITKAIFMNFDKVLMTTFYRGEDHHHAPNIMQQPDLYAFKRERFVNNVLSELHAANRSPIYGYQHLSLLSLEQATEKIIPLVSGLVNYVAQAKQQCNRDSTILTWDESAAIYLYSMPVHFFSRLNEALRDENRNALKPWFAFLKLIIHALEKLPSLEINVWRGVEGDVGANLVKNDILTWWSVNSCSMDLKVVEFYLGEKSTLFAIKSLYGKDISSFSACREECEVVLIPGALLNVKCDALNYKDHLFIVHLEEMHQSIQEASE